jgi:hypothetical protein
MALHESQGLSGRLTIELRDPDGRVVLIRHHDNLITTAGQMLVAQLFTGELSGKPELTIAVGGGTTPANPEDKALGALLAEVTATTQPIGLTTTDNGEWRARALVAATFEKLEGVQEQELREAGIQIRFPNGAPLLYNRVTFPAITRTAHVAMTLTWEVLF